MSIELVVTDLDGTLWDAGEAVHDTTLAALAELERRETPVLVATGRRRRSAQRGLERAGLHLPAVLLDGALGHDPRSGDTFHRLPFASDDAQRVLEAFLDHDVPPCVYVHAGGAAEHGVVASRDAATHPAHLASLADDVRIVDDLTEAVAAETVLCFGVVGGAPDHLAAVARDLADVAEPSITVDHGYGGASLMVPARDVTKWRGVLAYCGRARLDPQRVLAIGDGMNDRALLEGAAVAVVVSHGDPSVLELADHVIDPPHAGGWATILDLL